MPTEKENKFLIVLTGPTAVGKTALSIALAQHFGSEILSVDSRQFYRDMTIGTAKPSAEELDAVNHHLVDFLPVTAEYDVKLFETDALAVLDTLFTNQQVVFATGGSGLYIKTLCEGIDDMPDIPDSIRANRQKQLKENGLTHLTEELKIIDPFFYQQADLQNHRRVLRALEIYDTTGKPYSSFRNQERTTTQRPFRILKIGLTRNREELYDRINARVDNMLMDGLEDEVKSLASFHQLNALHTVGYQEFFPYFRGEYTLDEAIRLIKRNTRRFAKRQMTWFRKDQDIRWFNLSALTQLEAFSQISTLIHQTIKETHRA